MMNAEIRDAFIGVQAAWTSFTPTLTAATTNPTGQSYTGSAYMRIGKTVHMRAVITLSASTGSGAYSISLPASPIASTEQNLSGIITDTGVGVYACRLRFVGTATAALYCDPTTAGAALRAVSPTAPFTLGTGDIITICGSYETA